MLDDHSLKNYQLFVDQIKRWSQYYSHIVCSFIALKDKDNQPRIAEAIVSLNVLNNTKEQTYETKHILAGQRVFEFQNNFEGFFKTLSRGAFSIDARELSIEKSLDSISVSYFPINIAGTTVTNLKTPGLLMSGRNPHSIFQENDALRQLDWEVKAANPPFAGMEDLGTLLGFPLHHRPIGVPRIEVVASAIGLVDGESIIKNGIATIICRFSRTMNPKDVSLGYKIYHVEGVERGIKTGTEFEWKEKDGVLIGELKIPTKNAPAIQTFLNINAENVHEGWVNDPTKSHNTRFIIHSCIDPKLERLETCLSGGAKNNQDGFEVGIGLLLNMHGFSVVHYDLNVSFPEPIDVIAVDPSGRYLIGDCTLRDIDSKEKLSKLTTRTEKLKQALAEAGYKFLQVQPVIFTALSGSEISKADFEKAKISGIAVIHREEIRTLIQQASSPLKTAQLFDMIVSMAKQQSA